MPKKSQPEYFGGQALMEGVVMQGSQGYAMAARTPDGRIVYKTGRRRSLKTRWPILGLPLLRGVVSFAESMYVGFSSLTWSAFQAGEEEEEKLTWKEMAVAIISALALTIVFFVVLIHDDVLATGGTMAAVYDLVKSMNPRKIYVNFIIEIDALNGRANLPEGVEVTSLLKL